MDNSVMIAVGLRRIGGVKEGLGRQMVLGKYNNK